MTVSPVRRWLTLGVSTAALLAACPVAAQTATPVTPENAAQARPGAQAPAQGGLGTQNPQSSATTSAVPTAGSRTLSNGPQATGENQIEELVVTAERREESIQDTPIAVSAFSAEALKAKRLDGGESLVLSVPNVNYSRGNFGGYNFSIRGIGTKLVSNTGDPGVSFNVNELPVSANHLGDADFFDVERVEVLRGPQGTLFGRTATGGAVNVVTAKPTDNPGGSLTAEFGNYDSKKFTGFINVPVNDFFAFRLAGVFIDRDGFGQNLYTGNSVDGRDLHAIRSTFQFKFNDKFKANLIYEHFNEKDDRNRVGKQLCTKDPGLTSVGGVPLNNVNQGLTSQGCLPVDPYASTAFGTLNSRGTLAGIFNLVTGLSDQDVFGNHPMQNHNLHDIESTVDPIYQANENLLALHADYELTPNLTLSSITGYNRNTGFSLEDYDRIIASTPFNATPASTNAIAPAIAAAAIKAGLPAAFAGAYANAAYGGLYGALFPGGYINDPQLGPSNLQRVYDEGDTVTTELTQEVRLSSHFKGPLNFSVGGIFVNQVNFSNYYVLFNSATAYLTAQNALAVGAGGAPPYTIDPADRPSGFGHNYYDSRYGDMLNSYAGFGEVNYKVSDDLKITGGFRYTVDHKKGNLYPVLLTQPGSGPGTPVRPTDSVEAPTGRFNVEWTPHLGFTNQTLVYGTFSRGYKPGGFNTPSQDSNGVSGYTLYPATYEPEYVNAYEVGTKNTLLGGSLVLNATGFYYEYSGYQISEIVNKSSVQQNIDADIYGAELESIWQPIRNLTFNANIGYLHTKITSGRYTDQANLTQGDPSLTLLKDSSGGNCVVSTAGLAAAAAVNEGLPGTPNVPGFTGNSVGLLGGCSGSLAAFGLYQYANPSISTVAVGGQQVGQGVLVNLEGNDLPNSPDFTVSVGAQYVYELPREWVATIRGDFYWQDDSFARVYNSPYDKLKGYENVNATLTFDNSRLGVNLQLFVKNLTNSQPYTDLYLTDASSGLFLNTFTLDPRVYGVSLTKRF